MLTFFTCRQNDVLRKSWRQNAGESKKSQRKKVSALIFSFHENLSRLIFQNMMGRKYENT